VVARVALDAGHGGNDPGAVGPSGFREKDVTSRSRTSPAPVLSRELGIPTLLTRDDEPSRSARRACGAAPTLFSCRTFSFPSTANASDSGAAHGVHELRARRHEGRSRSPHRGARKTPPRSPRAPRLLDRVLAASRRPRRAFHPLWPNCSAVGDGLACREVRRCERDQGVKTAGFYVLLGAEDAERSLRNLVISNPGEEKRLATADYKQKLADAIVNAGARLSRRSLGSRDEKSPVAADSREIWTGA